VDPVPYLCMVITSLSLNTTFNVPECTLQMRPYVYNQDTIEYDYGNSLTLSIIHSRSPNKSSFSISKNELLLSIPYTNYLKTLLRPVCGFHVLISYVVLCLPVMEMGGNARVPFL
jgi:hypothetical protein